MKPQECNPEGFKIYTCMGMQISSTRVISNKDIAASYCEYRNIETSYQGNKTTVSLISWLIILQLIIKTPDN